MSRNFFEAFYYGIANSYTPLDYKGYEDYLQEKDSNEMYADGIHIGYAYRFNFENGYGASVIKHIGSHGSEKDLFELAVLDHGALCYDTEITDDVIGNLTNDEVLELLERIKNL